MKKRLLIIALVCTTIIVDASPKYYGVAAQKSRLIAQERSAKQHKEKQH